MSECKGTNYITESINLENNLYRSRIKTILKFGTIYINEAGAGFPHTNAVTIVDKITKSDLIYPEYSFKDIKITKWDGGKHYYATIGNITITDNNGRQKWNTKSMAYNVAKNFIKNQK